MGPECPTGSTTMAKPKATTTSVKPTTTTAPERSEEPKITVSSDDDGSGGWGWGVVAARGVALLGGAGVGTMSRRANRSGLRRPTLVGIVLGAALLVAGCGEAGVTLGQSKGSTSAWMAASPRSSLCSAWDSRPTWTGLELELDASDAQAPATVLPATRTYLGDLSGGFFVGKRIREIYGLTPDGGASVFDFPEIVGPGAWSSDIGTTWMRWSGRPRSSRPSSMRPRLRTSITRRCSTSWLSSNLDPACFTGGGGLKAVLV